MDLPIGWAAAEARWLEPEDDPAICRQCCYASEDCGRDPLTCAEMAEDRAAEQQFQAMRDEEGP